MMKLPLLKRPRFDFWFFVKAVVILAMLFFLVYPFSTLITRSFFSKKAAGVTLDNYATFFSKKYYLDALKNTLLITFASSFTCLLVGAPMAYLMTRYNIFGKNVIYVCIILALMSPPFIGAYSWILLFGRAGFITRLFAGIGVRTPTIYGPGGSSSSLPCTCSPTFTSTSREPWAALTVHWKKREKTWVPPNCAGSSP